MSAASRRDRPYQNVPCVPDTIELSLSDLVSEQLGYIEFEIGFGKGHFLLDRAAANPETSMVGFEVRRKWVDLVATRAAKRELENVSVWHGDIRTVLSRLCNNASLDRIFINFPDPWWKARHEKRMVITPDVVDQAARILKDGESFVQTDVDFRAEAYREVIASHTELVPAVGDGTIDENPYGVRSLREKNCEDVGLPIFRILFRRAKRRD